VNAFKRQKRLPSLKSLFKPAPKPLEGVELERRQREHAELSRLSEEVERTSAY
jgi:hypothetical protein